MGRRPAKSPRLQPPPMQPYCTRASFHLDLPLHLTFHHDGICFGVAACAVILCFRVNLLL